jgi:hypothetical protein
MLATHINTKIIKENTTTNEVNFNLYQKLEISYIKNLRGTLS